MKKIVNITVLLGPENDLLAHKMHHVRRILHCYLPWRCRCQILSCSWRHVLWDWLLLAFRHSVVRLLRPDASVPLIDVIILIEFFTHFGLIER